MVTFLLQEHFLKRKCILLADLEVRRILFQARLEWWEGQQGGQRTGEAGQRLRAGPAATPSLEAGMLPRVRGGEVVPQVEGALAGSPGVSPAPCGPRRVLSPSEPQFPILE